MKKHNMSIEKLVDSAKLLIAKISTNKKCMRSNEHGIYKYLQELSNEIS